MTHRNISKTIQETCRKLGITYTSCYMVDEEQLTDAMNLGELYIELKDIAGRIEEIAEKHEIDGLKKLLHTAALDLDKIDHDICKLAHRLIKEKQ